MPSSAPEGWTDWVRDEIREHERERAFDRPPEFLRYEIRERLGEGTSAVVYRAWDRELNRPVALKVLHEAASASDVGRERFRREAKAAAGLVHPNVAAVYDAGEEKGRPYLVMELVDGAPLSEVIRKEPADARARIRLLEKAARGVAAAHEKGIVHRDLKPDNILVTPSGEPKVGDFGLAHLLDPGANLTRPGTRLGTPLYMAPEQVEGRTDEISPRTDVYALGAILYEALTGRPPFQGETLAHLYGKIVREDPAAPRTLNPKVPRDVETIILKAMDRDPRRRYASAGELAEDLRRHLDGEPILARPAGVAHKLLRRLMRNPAAWALAAGALAAMAAAIVVWTRYREERALAVATLRDTARISVESALEMRRKGGNAEMRRWLPALETAYRGAIERAPGLAEVEYLMGRMYRALMEDEKALKCQERALGMQPAYASALYERAVLLSKKYGQELQRAGETLRALESGATPAGGRRPASALSVEKVERATPELVRLRDRILADCVNLERVLRGEPEEANVLAARGILTYYQGRYPEARTALEAAVRKNPLLEEAWETLARSAQAQAGETGDFEEKVRKWGESEAFYAEGMSKDRGYLQHWVGRSEVRVERGLNRLGRREDPLPDYRGAEEDLTQALLLSERSAEARRRRGVVRTLRGIYRMAHGQDPRGDYGGAEEDFAAAEKLDRGSPELWLWRGYLRTHAGVHLMQSAEGPLNDFARAEKDFNEALRLNPRYLVGWRYRGYLWTKRAYYRVVRGEDPLEEYAKAEHDYTEAVRVDGASPRPLKERGEVRLRRALLRIKRGEDPLPDFAASEGDYTRAGELSQADSDALAERGNVRFERALYREKAGDKAGAKEDFAAASRDFSDAVRLDPAADNEYEDRLREARKRAAQR